MNQFGSGLMLSMSFTSVTTFISILSYVFKTEEDEDILWKFAVGFSFAIIISTLIMIAEANERVSYL
jgi:hypothetical protein